MKLEIIGEWNSKVIDRPELNDITTALGKLFSNKPEVVEQELVTAIILETEDKNKYIQTNGVYTIYIDGSDSPSYVAEDLSHQIVEDLFVLYAKGKNEWRTRVDWKIDPQFN